MSLASGNCHCSCCGNLVSLFKQINISPDTWYAAIELANAFFSILVNKDHQKQFVNSYKASNTPLMPSFRGMATFQPCVIIQFAGTLIIFPFSKISQDISLWAKHMKIIVSHVTSHHKVTLQARILHSKVDQDDYPIHSVDTSQPPSLAITVTAQ